MKVRRLGPHTYYVEGLTQVASHANEAFISNAGFIITGDGVVIFDSLDSPALAAELVGKIRGLTKQPIKLVVISHYHADHFYGIPAFRCVGAKVWANVLSHEYLYSQAAATRLAERKKIIGPWLGPNFKLPLPDHWIDKSVVDFTMGDVHFSVRHLGPAHTAEDTVMLVQPDNVLYSGDIVYTGRVPYVGSDSNSKHWLVAITNLLKIHPRVMVPGHGPASDDPERDAQMTRDYLTFLRQQMNNAVENMVSFNEAYRKINWSRFSAEPTFNAANERNAYDVYLQMQAEWLSK